MHGSVSAPASTESPSSRAARRGIPALVMAGLLVACGSGEPPPATSVPERPPAPRHAVALLGFAELGGDPEAAWIATAVAEMVDLELSAGEALRVVPVARVREAVPEPPVGHDGALDRERLALLRDTLGADDFISGTYTSSGDEIRLSLRLLDGRTGEVRQERSGAVLRSELLEFVAATASSFRAALGVAAPPAARGGARASLPSDTEAARLYSEGLARLREFDAIRARDLFQQAVAREPDNPLVHAALAEAWGTLGYDGRARDAARRAYDLSAALSRERRLLIEARYREAGGEWDRAAGIYRTLHSVFPDQPDYGLALARALIPAGHRDEALEVVASLRRRPSPAGNDPGIDLVESEAAQAHGDYARALASARRAVAEGRARGSDLLVARAHFQEGVAQRDLGDLDAALQALRESERLFAAAGDQGGRAHALRYVGTIERRQGDLDAARRSYEDSLEITERIGDWRGTSFARSQLAVLLRHQGRLAEAQALHERLLAGHREVEDRDGLAVALNNLAYVERLRGELQDARAHLEEALALGRELGSRQNEAVTLNILGGVLLDLGELDEARAAFEQTLTLGRELDNLRSEAFSLYALGEVDRDQGRQEQAREHHEAALRLREQAGEKGTAVLSRLALAQLSLDEGHPEQAEAPAREAARYFEEEGERDSEARALCAVTRSLVDQGRLDEAHNAQRRAEEVGGTGENAAVRMEVALAGARLRLASGFDVARVVGRLDDVRVEAARRGMRGYELRARLWLGRLELRFGDPKTGQALLEAVRDESRAAGYERIARFAAEALATRAGEGR